MSFLTGLVITLFFIGLVSVVANSEKKGILHHRLEGGSGLAIAALFFALLALGERILYDLARIFVGPGYDYFNDLPTIIVHSFFIIPLLAISIAINVTLGEKKEKYAIVLVPYFFLSLVLAFQLIMQISVYFTDHHTPLQLYLVLLILIALCSYAIYYIQDKFEPNHQG
jgi:hypothetical protein